MPKGNVYAVEDTKADVTLQFWLAENDDVAMRLLHDPVNDPDHAFGKHPRDYELKHVGLWDPEDRSTPLEGTLARYVCNLYDLTTDGHPSRTYEPVSMDHFETVETTKGLNNGS